MASSDDGRVAALASARAVIESVVWCTMATVGPDGAPRTRIVHPIWDWERGIGWVTSRGTALRRRHLAHHPGASCAYWSPAHDLANLDCRATWAPAEERQDIWDRCAAEPAPMGFDPTTMFPDGPTAEGFAPIQLTPYRIRVHLLADATTGQPATMWSA
jgi:hypothetical protein